MDIFSYSNNDLLGGRAFKILRVLNSGSEIYFLIHTWILGVNCPIVDFPGQFLSALRFTKQKSFTEKSP